MKFTDAAELAGTRKTQDGYLVAEAFVARTGIQVYAAHEMGLTGDGVVRVYRPEDEVKAPASVRTYTHAPITMGHPSEAVTKDNWADLAKGEVSTEAEWVDGKLRLPLIVKDAGAIAAIEAGTRELSAGYTSVIDHTPGTTDEGEEYDAIQRDIRINHLAIVPRGRAGIARIGDNADTGKDRATWGASPILQAKKEVRQMADTMQTVVLGDQAVQVSAADTAKIEAFKASQAKALSDAETAHKAALAAKDAELATKDAEIEKMKAAALSGADLDKRVADRAKLIGDAAKIAKDVKVDGLSDAEIRKAVVTAKLGDAAITDKSDAYIEARFDVLAEDAGKDPVADAIKSAAPVTTQTADADKAYAENLAYLSDAHRTAHIQKEA